MRILVAVDGSEHSQRTVDFIVRQQAMFAQVSETICLYIETPPPLRGVGALGADPGMPPIAPVDPGQVVGPRLDELRRAGHAPELIVREGDPGVEIAQVARERACDLIVMGSHGRGFFKRAVLGSVASKVLSSCEVPVLLVR